MENDIATSVSAVRSAFVELAQLALQRIPSRAAWSREMRVLRGLVDIAQHSTTKPITRNAETLRRGFAKLPLTVTPPSTSAGRILGYIDATGTLTSNVQPGEMVLSWWVPLNHQDVVACVAATLPNGADFDVDAVSDATVGQNQRLTERALALLACKQQLTELEKARLVAGAYAVDTAQLLEYAYLDDDAQIVLDTEPVRDIRLMLAQADREGLDESIALVQTYRLQVAGRSELPTDLLALDAHWPLDDLFAPWNADATGTLPPSTDADCQEQPASRLRLPPTHPVFRRKPDGVRVRDVSVWLETRQGRNVELAREAIAFHHAECRWLATWADLGLVAMARTEPKTVYNETRAAFATLFHPDIGQRRLADVLPPHVADTLAQCIGVTRKQLTVSRLPPSWRALQALNLGRRVSVQLAQGIATLARDWRALE